MNLLQRWMLAACAGLALFAGAAALIAWQERAAAPLPQQQPLYPAAAPRQAPPAEPEPVPFSIPSPGPAAITSRPAPEEASAPPDAPSEPADLSKFDPQEIAT